jgi:hypothetical protein
MVPGVTRRRLQATTRITSVLVAIKMVQQSHFLPQVLLDARAQAQVYADSYLAGQFLAAMARLDVLLLTVREAPVVIYSENLYVPMSQLIDFLTATLDPAVAAADLR